MLNDKQLAALDKLEALAKAELSKYQNTYNMYHDTGYRLLITTPNWLNHVRTFHTHPNSEQSVEGSLENLRKVVRHFKFNLKTD